MSIQELFKLKPDAEIKVGKKEMYFDSAEVYSVFYRESPTKMAKELLSTFNIEEAIQELMS